MTPRLNRKDFVSSTASSPSSPMKNAVDFLKNDKVKTTPLRRRVLFLKSKGLKTGDIVEAFRQAGQPIERAQIEEIEPDIAITTIQTQVTPVSNSWSVKTYLAFGTMSVLSTFGAYQLYKWLTENYDIHVNRKSDKRYGEPPISQPDPSARLQGDLANLHSELAKTKAEARRALSLVDKIQIERQKLEKDLHTLRQEQAQEIADDDENIEAPENLSETQSDRSEV